MPFSELAIREAWKRAGGSYPPNPSHCECTRRKHYHPDGRCNKELIWENKGREDRGKWEAHHFSPAAGDILENCEILCCDCHNLAL